MTQLPDGRIVAIERTQRGTESVIARVTAGAATCATSQPSTECFYLDLRYENDATTAGTSRLSNATLSRGTDQSATAIITQATYAYRDTGALQQVTSGTGEDALTVAYEYDRAGRLAASSPNGSEPYLFTYAAEGSALGSEGAVITIRAPGEGEADTYWFDYTTSTSIINGGPYELSATAVRLWGQTDAPSSATTAYGPLLSTVSDSDLPALDEGATTYYLNRVRQTVNRAQPPGPSFDATGFVESWQYDKSGHVERRIGATEREAALQPEAGTDSEPFETGDDGSPGSEMTPVIEPEPVDPSPPRFEAQLPEGAHLGGLSVVQVADRSTNCSVDGDTMSCTAEGGPDQEFSEEDYESGTAPIAYLPGHETTNPETGLAYYVRPVPIDRRCYKQFKSVYKTRFMSCKAERHKTTVYDIKPKRPPEYKGWFEVEVITVQYMAWDSPRVILQAETRLVRTFGSTITGATVRGLYQCTEGCNAVDQGTIPSGTRLSKASYRKAAGSTKRTLASGKMGMVRHHYKFTFAVLGGSDAIWWSTVNHVARCDNGVARGGTWGCVVAGSMPDPLTYSVSNPKNGRVAEHIRKALASDLRGSTTPLRRTQVAYQQGANRRAACPQSIPRPSGYQCDEYPFASTYEGGASGGKARVLSNCQLDLIAGRGPVGFSRCMVPSSHNSSAGSKLGWYYAYERIVDRDTFFVRIIP